MACMKDPIVEHSGENLFFSSYIANRFDLNLISPVCLLVVSTAVSCKLFGHSILGLWFLVFGQIDLNLEVCISNIMCTGQ
jgi:hypothetical protein